MNDDGFTREQREAIFSRGGSLLVSASAGSGKTTVLIRRVLSLIEDGESLAGMVITTYTRSAARDIKEKLQLRLMEAQQRGMKNAERELAALPTADIGTLHSWCQKLIKRYFYAIDVDPAFEIADADETAVMLDEAVSATIDEMQGSDAAFSVLYDALRFRRSDADLRKLLVAVYNFAATRPDPDLWLDSEAKIGLYDGDVLQKIADEEKRRIADRFDALAEDFAGRAARAGYNGIMSQVAEFREQVRGKIPEESEKPDPGEKERFAALDAEFATLVKKFANESEKIAQFYDLPAPECEAMTDATLEAVKRIKSRYAALKRAKARLDYSDLEHYTLALVSDPAVRELIRAEVKHMFVDEYQDVNPLQETIIRAVGGSDLFLVGDVKQSIYAFRLCDPTIFIRKYEEAERGGRPPVKLNDNFRSADEILGFANAAFDMLMTERFGHVDYKNTARLRSGTGLAGGEVKLNLVVHSRAAAEPTGVYSVRKASGEAQAYDKADAQANLVVNDIVNKLVNSSVGDGRGGKRPLAYSDIAVLASTREPYLRLIYEKLRRLNIPATIADEVSFCSVHEVSVLISMMKCLVSRSDPIALTAVLRSALVGMTDDELAAVRLFSPAEAEFPAACERYAAEHDDETARKINAFFAMRDDYLTYSYTHTAGEVAGRLVSEHNWFAHVLSGPAADMDADALDAFLRHVNGSAYGGSVGEYLRSLEAREPKYARPPLTDAVQLSTIHASKGLEYPFVYLVNIDRSFNFDDLRGSYLIDRELGLCMRNFDESERAVKPNKLTFAAGISCRRALVEERMRLLYVALTRAKNGLYVYANAGENDELFTADERLGVAVDPEGGTSFFDWLRPLYYAYGYSRYAAEDCALVGETDSPESGIRGRADERLVAMMREWFATRERKRVTVKTSATRMSESNDDEEERRTFIAGEDDDRALVRGNAYHKAMELTDYSHTGEQEWERLCSICPAVRENVKKKEYLAAFDFFRTLTAGKKIYREKSFVYSRGGVLIQGVIDLLIADGKNCAIVDYKTSKEETILSGAYDLQLSVYAAAARDILGMNVTRAAVYSFSTGKLYDAKEKDLPV